MKNPLGVYLYNILLNIDVDGNVYIIGLIVVFLKLFHITNPVPAAGNSHYTISQTLAEMRQQPGDEVGCIGCKILTRIWSLWIKKPDYDHCTDAMTGMPEDVTTG